MACLDSITKSGVYVAYFLPILQINNIVGAGLFITHAPLESLLRALDGGEIQVLSWSEVRFSNLMPISTISNKSHFLPRLELWAAIYEPKLERIRKRNTMSSNLLVNISRSFESFSWLMESCFVYILNSAFDSGQTRVNSGNTGDS
ncbi:hypothetical protein PHYBLDRAFT_148731 [Phycomyces blakesleeanus NRRL 1555(-)]|uniref:Uncharacterized protein n=1 Tax=Phycomyces blakesleeanus (strain ATCC 8743b / DSM 1359 / FGSC 10004 / NBRC 33097 / NRRL 1555) TaxID=763407 RepID=A0A167LD12_PHYB8|nr:hypothetical protein PHYBLDRAFT_148731 [Phycomyces blakesleeanus NRRL 1555(-)]OAD70178.1 hypothetical protein PHYBLDRAFT_148731 [Phycomyces blakesleeanus NRRL 1555(-)]|eukprot:XP_018288218.1 hypothetical protein PHYBLDRAFT_148731 [Phycomyces blakesleeanus NRRL 1555(-)]